MPISPSQMTDEQLRLHLQTTHKERFYMLISLIKRVRRLQKTKPVAIQSATFAKQKNLTISGIKNKI